MPAITADVDAFARLLTNLLPGGDAWPTEPDSVQQQAIRALVRTFAVLNARGNVLISEAFPGTTNELLPQWEQSLGLPDACSPPLSTVTQRQMAVVAKLISRGGQSIPYFVALAAASGAAISIDQFAPFRADANRADDPANDRDWALAWRVNMPEEVTSFPFRADSSYADEPLDLFQQGTLECRLRQAAPAHARLSFAYPDATEALLGAYDRQVLTGQDQQVLTPR